MPGDTAIEWTDKSWNPTTGCTQVSPGCAHCYAKTLTERFHGKGSFDIVTLHPKRLLAPLSWKTPSRVFVNSMSDLFHKDIPDEFIDRVFAVMALTPQHTYQVLTKRPERMRAYMTKQWLTTKKATWEGGPWPEAVNRVTDALLDMIRPGLSKTAVEQVNFAAEWQAERYPDSDGFIPVWPLPNVWLGVTVENQRFADERIPILLDTPAAVRFISAEPLLGPLRIGQLDTPKGAVFPLVSGALWPEGGTPDDIEFFGGSYGASHLDWLIVGGESGPKHRPFNVEWARFIVEQCHDAGVACFVKQLGGARPGNKLDDLPEDLRVREYPV
jgi:protein gp37